MDLSLEFCFALVADAIVLRFIAVRRRVARFVCMSIFFALETVLIVALVQRYIDFLVVRMRLSVSA
jgi:hypothetical protein